MILSISKILVIARTEFRFGLRRGGPVVGILAVSLVISGSALFLVYNDAQDDQVLFRSLLGGGMNELYMAWPAFLLLTLTVLPMVCATAVSSDRQFQVFELLRSLPLNGWTYLAGKILGTWAVVILIGGTALAAHILLHLMLAAPVNIDLYLELTLLCGLPLTLWATAIGILVGSIFASRRAAWLAGLAIGLVSVPVAGLAFRPSPDYRIIAIPAYMSRFDAYSQMATHNVLSDYIFQHLQVYSMLADIRIGLIPPATGDQVLLTLAAGLAVLILGGLLARTWLARKENF